MKEPAVPEFISQANAAALLQIHPTTFWRRVKEGSLPGPVYVGHLPRWHRATLLAVVAATTKPAA